MELFIAYLWLLLMSVAHVNELSDHIAFKVSKNQIPIAANRESLFSVNQFGCLHILPPNPIQSNPTYLPSNNENHKIMQSYFDS